MIKVVMDFASPFDLLRSISNGQWQGGTVATAQKILAKVEVEELIFDGQSPTKKATTEMLTIFANYYEGEPISQSDVEDYIYDRLINDLWAQYGIDVEGNKMEEIEITKPNGGRMYFAYLEQVAEWLGRVHHRQIDIAEELESQITDVSGCDFTIDGTKYHYKQTEYDN